MEFFIIGMVINQYITYIIFTTEQFHNETWYSWLILFVICRVIPFVLISLYICVEPEYKEVFSKYIKIYIFLVIMYLLFYLIHINGLYNMSTINNTLWHIEAYNAAGSLNNQKVFMFLVLYPMYYYYFI